MTGCGTNQQRIKDEFNVIISEPVSEETTLEATNYVAKNISKLDQENASDVVVGLETYVLSYNQDSIDYHEWISVYQNYIEPQLLALYQLKLKEQDNPLTEDATLMVSWSELLERTYEIEQYIRNNKNYTLVQKDILWMYGNDIKIILMGTNNSPIFNYKTYQFSEEAKMAYEAFLKQHPDSVTAWTLSEYFAYLEGIGYSMNYSDKIASKTYFDTCDLLVSESGKRVLQ